MGLSQTVKAALLDAYFGDGGLTVPATLYVGLSNQDPTTDGSGTNEPTTNGYARVAVDNTPGGDADTDWNAATIANPSIKDNSVAITFPESTGAWLSGTSLTHFVIYDDTQANGGNFIAGGALNNPRTVDAAGITLEFAAGELNIQLETV